MPAAWSLLGLTRPAAPISPREAERRLWSLFSGEPEPARATQAKKLSAKELAELRESIRSTYEEAKPIRAMPPRGCGWMLFSIRRTRATPSSGRSTPPHSTPRYANSRQESCKRSTLPMEPLKLIECPRDAWQGLPQIIPAKTKVAHLLSLVEAGFQHIDAVSFVSPKHVRQMADSEEVMERFLASLPPSDAAPEIIGIVVNEKGVERALARPALPRWAIPIRFPRISGAPMPICPARNPAYWSSRCEPQPNRPLATWSSTSPWRSATPTTNRGGRRLSRTR